VEKLCRTKIVCGREGKKGITPRQKKTQSRSRAFQFEFFLGCEFKAAGLPLGFL
jgi:hypothetical protein